MLLQNRNTEICWITRSIPLPEEDYSLQHIHQPFFQKPFKWLQPSRLHHSRGRQRNHSLVPRPSFIPLLLLVTSCTSHREPGTRQWFVMLFARRRSDMHGSWLRVPLIYRPFTSIHHCRTITFLFWHLHPPKKFDYYPFSLKNAEISFFFFLKRALEFFKPKLVPLFKTMTSEGLIQLFPSKAWWSDLSAAETKQVSCLASQTEILVIRKYKGKLHGPKCRPDELYPKPIHLLMKWYIPGNWF